MTKQRVISGYFFLTMILVVIVFSCDKELPTESKNNTTIFLTKISGDALIGVPGDTLSTPLTVLLNDSNGKVLSGVRVDFRVLSGSASLADSIVVSNDIGKASTKLNFGKEESFVKIEAKIFGSENKVIFSLSAINLPPTMIIILTGNNQNCNQGEMAKEPLQIKVINERGESVNGCVVSFEILKGVGLLSSYLDTTDTKGIAETLLTTGDYIGDLQISASIFLLEHNLSVTFQAVSLAPTYSISGKVRNFQGKGISNISVYLTSTDDMIFKTFTDNNGDYSFSDLISGTYYLLPWKSNYKFEPQQETISIQSDHQTNILGEFFTSIVSEPKLISPISFVYTTKEPVFLWDPAGNVEKQYLFLMSSRIPAPFWMEEVDSQVTSIVYKGTMNLINGNTYYWKIGAVLESDVIVESEIGAFVVKN